MTINDLRRNSLIGRFGVQYADSHFKKIEFLPNMISNYQIEKFVPNAKLLDWKTVIEGIDRGQDRNFIDTAGKDIFKYEDSWIPVKWFSIAYIRPLIIEKIK